MEISPDWYLIVAQILSSFHTKEISSNGKVVAQIWSSVNAMEFYPNRNLAAQIRLSLKHV